MSMPKFPEDAGNITRDNAINQILSSIAMEELGLSHIINAEGEKMQYILGTLEGAATLETPPTVDQVLQANESIQKTLSTIMAQQMFLSGKMSDALNAPGQGPMPVITIGTNGDWFVDGVDTGQSAVGDITISPAGNWVINGVETNVPAQGPTGPTGPAGNSPVITIGANGDWFVDGVDTGQTAVPTIGTTLSISPTDTWMLNGVDTGIPVTGTLTIGANGNWFVNGVDTGVAAQGPVGATGAQGPTGPTGPTGATGASGTSPVVTIGANGDWFINGTDTGQPSQGPAGTSAIIPYASGIPTAINMIVGGLAGIPEFIGFGLSSPGATVLGTNIDFTGGTLTNFAYTMPRNGSITDISASFLVIVGVSVSMNPTIYLYKAPAGTATFTQIPGATLVLPDASLISVGAVLSGSVHNLNVPVNTGDQILLVAAGTSASQLLSAGSATGYISAGVGLAT